MDIEDVREFIKLADPETTTTLDLSNKDIRELPPEIGTLYNLEHLDLSYNYLEKLPMEIGKLTQLKTLLLLRNEIKELPAEIGYLINLTLLDVSHNRFYTFPKQIGNLINLKTLDASYCELKTLPLDFIELLSLKELYFEENQFEFPPAKVVKRGLYATMHYLTSEKKRKDTAKVILQVFNMPQKLQTPFNQYVAYFNDMISSVNDEDIKFDINFIKQDLEQDIELKVGVENYLHDFLKFVRERVEAISSDNTAGSQISILDLQVVELRKHIQVFNESLDTKVDEIREIKQQMENFHKMLGHK